MNTQRMNTLVVSGGTGFIGRAFIEAFREIHPDWSILRLTRTPNARDSAGDRARGAVTDVGWGPRLPLAARENEALARAVDGASAVLHLAGETAVGQRLTSSRKEEIEGSRVESTRLLVEAMRKAVEKPAAFVSASAVGYYGARDGGEALDENAAPGSDFLATLCTRWEAEANHATELGVRVAIARLGIVLGPGGGALEAMALPVRMFVGGKIGSGTQVVSWIERSDAARALTALVTDASFVGPVNITAPGAVTNAELTRAIGRALRRPTPFAVPRFALRAALGDGADALTTGQRVVPKKLLAHGFTFRFPEVGPAVEASLR